MVVFLFTEDPPVGGTDVDIQLLEAAKAGDMEVVKVCLVPYSNNWLVNLFTLIRISVTSEQRFLAFCRD